MQKYMSCRAPDLDLRDNLSDEAEVVQMVAVAAQTNTISRLRTAWQAQNGQPLTPKSAETADMCPRQQHKAQTSLKSRCKGSAIH